MLASALEEATVRVPPDTPLETAAKACLEMATAYLEDGRHFRSDNSLPDALAAFSYGHGWLDAAARVGLLSVPTDSTLFTQ
ncbi:MAG: DUF357 domain-containing protein [Natrialbaceae archaeon]|nr:DUF357 domain-containing protein [Natrialbaceae archaeon]